MTRDGRKDRLIKLEDLGVKSLADDFVIRLFSITLQVVRCWAYNYVSIRPIIAKLPSLNSKVKILNQYLKTVLEPYSYLVYLRYKKF